MPNNKPITVYVVMSQTGTVFSRLLKVITQDPYNHVSISLDSELNLMYSFARRKIHYPWIAGFIEETPKGGMFERKPKTECSVYALPVTQEQYHLLLENLSPFLLEPERYRYNFLGLPFIWMGVPFQRKYHYVCSQFVALLLQESGIVDNNRPSSLMRPYDFAKIETAELIYQGKLKDYCSDTKTCHSF